MAASYSLLTRFFLLLVTVVISSAFAQTETKTGSEDSVSVTEVTSVEGITEYLLDNGLRVLLFPDQSKQQITVNITYLVGSRHEAYGESGMAHLLEHLVFKGTPDHPNIPAELTEHGASPNGTTWLDRTNYFETFSASDENLEWALDLEADRMVNSFISKDDLDSEMTVVRNEWERSENNPSRVLGQRIKSVAFLWHNYSNATIGARSDIENVPIDRLQGFYKKYYQPDNAVLIIAGRFDTPRALELVKEKFGSIPRPDRSGANQLFPTYTMEPAQDGERSVTLRRVGDVQLVTMAYHVPSGSHQEYVATDVLSHLLGTAPSGRLYKNLVETGLASNVSAYAEQFNEPGLLMVSAEVRKEDSVADAEAAIHATLADLIKDNPPTQEEVERAVLDYNSTLELMFNDPQSTALQLSEWVAMGDWRLLFFYRDALQGVTPEDAHGIAQKYLLSSNRTTGYFYPVDETPTRAEIPQKPDVLAMVSGYVGREVIEQGEAFDPSPDNIDSRTRNLTLSNGTRVALLTKKNRGGAVTLAIQFRHGTEDTLTGRYAAADLAGGMLIRGTVNKTREQISDELDRLKAQGSVSGGIDNASASFITIRASLPELLDLIAEIFNEPAFDEKEFNTLKEQKLASLESQMSEPVPLAQIKIWQHLTPYPVDHPLHRYSYQERIDRISATSLEQAKDFYNDFYGGSGGTISIVGDFDEETIVDQLENLFGGMSAKEDYVRIPAVYQSVETLVADIETPDKSNAVMYAGITFPMQDDHPDFPAIMLGNYILGGGFLNSRLATRIRQQDGLSYGVGSFFSAQAQDEFASLGAYAIFAPENADKVVVAFREEIAKVLESGFTQEEVDAAISGMLDSNKNGRADDRNLNASLNGNLFNERTMAFVADLEAKLAALTPDTVNEAFRQYIDLDRITIVRAGDFANKLPKGNLQE